MCTCSPALPPRSTEHWAELPVFVAFHQLSILHVCVCVSHCRVWRFATPWTVAHQVPLSMRFSRQWHCSGLPFPSPGTFPTQESSPGLPHCRETLYHPSHQGGWYSAHSVHHSLSFPAVLPTPVSILYPCPENRFISTIFSRFHTYMLIYDICFLFLTYFSLYDRFWVHPQSALFFIFFLSALFF